MTRVKEQGSVVGFVMVGLVLAALVIGGIYLVRNQLGERLAGGSSLDQATEQAADDTKKTPDSEEAKTDDEAAKEEPADSQPDEQAPADQPTEADQPTSSDSDSATAPAVSDDATTEQTEAEDQRLAQTGVSDATQPAEVTRNDNLPTTGVELPQTGAGDFVWSALPVAAVVGAVVTYRRSNLL